MIDCDDIDYCALMCMWHECWVAVNDSVNCSVGVVLSGPIPCELNCLNVRHVIWANRTCLLLGVLSRPSQQSRSVRRLRERNRYQCYAQSTSCQLSFYWKTDCPVVSSAYDTAYVCNRTFLFPVSFRDLCQYFQVSDETVFQTGPPRFRNHEISTSPLEGL
jgi:hypothetical protein